MARAFLSRSRLVGPDFDGSSGKDLGHPSSLQSPPIKPNTADVALRPGLKSHSLRLYDFPFKLAKTEEQEHRLIEEVFGGLTSPARTIPRRLALRSMRLAITHCTCPLKPAKFSAFPVWCPPAFSLCAGPAREVISPDSFQIDPLASASSQNSVSPQPPRLQSGRRTFRNRFLPTRHLLALLREAHRFLSIRDTSTRPLSSLSSSQLDCRHCQRSGRM
jgi:hypothetical protein